MKIKNYKEYSASDDYVQYSGKTKYSLGDIVIHNVTNEIGIVIQLHSKSEFRTHKFGNTSNDEVRLATLQEYKKFSPNISKEKVRSLETKEEKTLDLLISMVNTIEVIDKLNLDMIKKLKSKGLHTDPDFQEFISCYVVTNAMVSSYSKRILDIQ